MDLGLVSQAQAKKRYYDKLKCLGSTSVEEEDPYLPDISSKASKSDSSLLWPDDNTKWPSVEFGSVYVYLIHTPGPFTHGNMTGYKSLDASMAWCTLVSCESQRLATVSSSLFVLRFYGPVNPMGSCRARSVYLTTLLLGRLSPRSG